MSSLDYLDLCRLCLVKDRVSVPIFEGEGDVRQIFLKIAACLPVKVGREDKLPKKICDDCVYKVELFYQFWNTTANAEKQLLQWLGDVSMDDKQGYVTAQHPSLMKPGQNPGDNRLDGSVMPHVNDHPNNMGMGMLDGMGMGMPMMIPTSGQQQQPQQQMTSVPMDPSGNPVQTVQAVPGPSTQPSHDQIAQRKVNPATNQLEEEEESDEDENSDDECDGDDGMAVKEESEEDPNNSRTIEPTTFVNVSLACDEAGPSGLQQQKIGEMPEMVMPPTDGDPKSGPTTLPISQEKKSGRRKKSVPASRAKKSDKEKKPAAAAASEKPDIADQPPEQPSRLKSVRSKRKVEPVVAEESVPPKKRKLGRRPTRKAAFKISMNFSSESEDVDESSHDYWRNSDEEPPPAPHVEVKEVKTERDDSSNDYWRDDDEEPGKAMEIKTKTGYECSACEMTFTVRRKLNKHMLKHNNQKPYECPTCQKKFKYSVGLKNHIKSQHSDDAPIFTCEMCEFTTKQEHYLQEHFTRKHTEEYRYQCSSCGKHFKAERDYKAHMSNHDTGPQICDICGVTYPNKISLYSHKNYKHTEKDKPFECEICKKRLRTQKNLENHMQHHNQTYVCEECGVKFARQTGLSKHRKIHREKSCLCPVCGKAFACMTTVRVHMITHSGDRPYICDVCGNSYTQRSSLMLHWRKKHPEASQPPPPVTLKNIPETLKSDAD